MTAAVLRRAVAIGLLSVSLGLAIAFLVPRGSAAGADALAYWGAARTWLAGLDPRAPGGIFLPWIYAPWLLPFAVPWALLPWDVAWLAWRAAMVLLFAWSVAWAYRRRPLATALLVALLAGPLAATFDTGNVTLFLALAIWAAQSAGPRLGGALWTFAAAVKWIPATLWFFLPPRTRLWGLAGAAVVVLLTLATWPSLPTQLELAATGSPAAFPRPFRIDHVVLVWAIVPWLWRRSFRPALPRPEALRAAARAITEGGAPRLGERVRAFLGLS